MIQFDKHIFANGWLNHQLGKPFVKQIRANHTWKRCGLQYDSDKGPTQKLGTCVGWSSKNAARDDLDGHD